MNKKMLWALALVLLASVAYGGGEDANAIVGQWLTADKDAHVEISAADGTYQGKIVWMKDSTYSKDDPEAGKPIHDRENPDPAKRNQPILGSTILFNLKYVGDNQWKNGTIYDPESGNVYKARLSLTADGCLKVRGFLGVSLFGETAVWTRVDDQDKKPVAPVTQDAVKPTPSHNP